jgi:glycosyltransferase involved in cell wall biosynthesis
MEEKTKYPKISIVTPSLNQGKYIEDCIQSVLNQNYPNFEHIIIDGGSTDGTIEILKKYPHLKWISEPDEGQSDAINKGFRISTGDIIAWLNSDDYYCENIFYKIAKIFYDNNNIYWIYGNSRFVDQNGKLISHKKALPFSHFILKVGGFLIHQPSVFLRKEILKEIGYLNENFHGVMDIEWYNRIAIIYKPRQVNIDIACFRWHPNSKSSSPKKSEHEIRSLNERISVTTKYYPFLKKAFNIAPRFTNSCLINISRIIKLFLQTKTYFLN